MTILTHTEGLQPRLTTDPTAYDLELGEYWEQLLADYLTAQGIRAYRPRQVFVPSHRLQSLRGFSEATRAKKMPLAEDRSLLRPYQRDLLIDIGGHRRLSVEVKARSEAAFRYSDILVGCCPKWDLKRFKVDAVVLINQATGDAWVATGDRSEWLRVMNRDLCYSVPKRILSPIETWVDYLKDSYPAMMSL